jgi:NTE family protein
MERTGTMEKHELGVALSAGGAAAMAQIGVLEELADAGVSIGAVAGTSAGAMVGAALAAGDLAGLRDTMTSLSRTGVLRLYDPTWPRTGLFEGRKAMELIRPHIGERIEDLPVPYAAVAVDLRTGDEVVLREGSVLDAIRASVAVPGLFTPRPRDGRCLVDGGLVDPVPVSVARQLGARFVIAVSVLTVQHAAPRLRRPSANARRRLAPQLLTRFLARLDGEAPKPAPRREPEAEPTPVPWMPGLVEILQGATRIAEAQIAALRLGEDPPDFLIEVPVEHIGLFDFHRTAEAVERGRAAARKVLPALLEKLSARNGLFRMPFRRAASA